MKIVKYSTRIDFRVPIFSLIYEPSSSLANGESTSDQLIGHYVNVELVIGS